MNIYPTKTLGEICETTSGGTPSRANSSYYNGSIPWVKSGELNKGIIYDTEEKISEEAIKNSSAKIFPKGTLLIALYGATIGKLAFLGVDAATNQAVCGIYQNENIESKYLYNFLFHKKQDLVKQGIGGAQPNISQTILKKLEIPLPDLTTQQAIVSKIEELFSDLDKGIEELKKAQEQLKVYRQSVLKWAFEGKLTYENVKDGELPDGWEEKGLGQIFKVSSGKGIKINQLKGGEYCVYGGNGLNGFHTEYLIEDPVLIIGRVGVKCGVTHITRPKSWVSDNALIVKPIIKDFDLKFFKLRLEYENLNKLSVSTAQPVISGNSIYSVIIFLPPLEEQQRIVEEIERRLSVADKMEEGLKQSLAKAESLRQSILKKAFSGELV